QVTRRPVSLAAYEPTPEHEHAEALVAEGQKLARALTTLLERNAGTHHLIPLLGPLGDSHSERVRAVALHELSQLKLADGRGVRGVLADKLGATSPFLAGAQRTQKVPESMRREMESRLGVS